MRGHRLLSVAFAWCLAWHNAHAISTPKLAPVQCEQVDMRADSAECTANVCHLRDHARIACGDWFLLADAIDLYFDAEHRFAGAEAIGHTVMVQKEMVATCSKVSIGADQVTGRIEDATIALRAPLAQPDANGIPQGRDTTVIHGDITRLDPAHYVARGGDFTACDCGAGEAPSWRLGASTVDITVGDRAVIWGPRLYINPLSLGLVPITPPLLPLSLPLRERAVGFLPPIPRKYSGAWLALDLPFFIPLGDSYDITLFVGLRPDWRATQSTAASLHFWGAPRVGLQFRYAPVEGTQGRFDIELTHDGARGMAQQVLLAEGVDLQTANASQRALDAQRRALVNRIVINAQHRSRLAPRLDWLLDAHWRSDDLIPKDFAFDVAARFATYIPSRSQLSWRTSQGTAVASADWLLRLDNLQPGPDGAPLPAFSNTQGAESGTMHRGPWLGWQWLPQPLGAGFTLDGGLNILRLGTWSQRDPDQSLVTVVPAVQNQAMANAVAAIGWQKPVGPLRLAGRAAFDGLVVAPAHAQAYVDTAIVAQASADVRLVRDLGAWRHMVNPTLQYRGLVARPSAAPSAVDMLHAIDERTVRRITHQLRLTLRQSLQHPPSGSVANLELAQPLDARSGAWLSPWGTLMWSHPRLGNATLRMSFDYRYKHTQPMRELVASYDWGWRWLHFNANYDRLAPNADRFVRSIYELAAPQLPLAAYETAAPWAHLVRASLSLVLPRGFGLAYAAQYNLPAVGTGASPCAVATPGDPSPLQRGGCFIQHAFALDYTSPCNCWGIKTLLTWLPHDLINPTRLNITFAVADTVMSMEPTTY